MKPIRVMFAITISIVLILFAVTISSNLAFPLLSKSFLTLDDSISVYIDTLATVESGSVMIPIDRDRVVSVEIVFENEGKKDDYTIRRSGWYVLVTYKNFFQEVKDVSFINTYPEGGEFRKIMAAPSEICVNKDEGDEHAEVGRCLRGS